jgi:hypothetical protein
MLGCRTAADVAVAQQALGLKQVDAGDLLRQEPRF